jgi:mannose-6-phosphate isomerase-like protein (cupin superfamily)
MRRTDLQETAMYVQAPRDLPASPIPGIAHLTLARHGEGLEGLSVWKQSIAPGQGTPPHRHDCEEVVVVLEGHGELRIEGGRLPFGPGATLVLPCAVDHQIVNTGDAPLTMVATFGATPVGTFDPAGEALALPWPT